ncbi:hypothetical protein AAVH_27136, partial [Aphelenchoides avenae]
MLPVSTIVRYCIDGFLILFALSVLGCVLRLILRKHESFVTSFFVLYAVQSAIAIAAYGPRIMLYQLAPNGLLPEFLLHGIGYKTIFVLATSLEYAHYSLHVLISINRYAALRTIDRQ